MKRPRYQRGPLRSNKAPSPPPKASPGPTDEELWQRTMEAVDVVLAGDLKHDRTAVTQRMLAAIHGLTLEQVRELDAVTFEVMAAKGFALVSRMILHLGTIPAKPIEP